MILIILCINYKKMFIQLIAPKTVVLFERPVIILWSNIIEAFTQKTSPFVPSVSHKNNIRIRKRKNWQSNSKSSVTIQGVKKQINRRIFFFERFNKTWYDTALKRQGNNSKGAAVHSSTPSKNFKKCCCSPQW